MSLVVVARLQDRVAGSLGVSHGHRIDTVVRMLENNARRAPGYWIQLSLATGIATLGLVLGSTAVVIGAMLVSPLMGPIIELGMGFAVGSSLLVIRAALRVLLSVVVVIAGAALLTLALPFHEVTSEIASRTSPTALDLLVAVFCALTAAYTAVRAGSDTAAAAAGTAIGIALVPPLCVAGFGVGTASKEIAGGATLLFTANLFAILVLAVLSFMALGFSNVNASMLEEQYMERDATRTGQVAERVHGAFRTAFGSKYGLAMRIGVPLLFLLAVYVPLGRALDEVSWEVRARAAIKRIVSDEAPQAVQTSLVVERHTIALRLLMVGSLGVGAKLEERLTARIAKVAGTVPSVTVSAVPDDQTLSALRAEETRTSRKAEPEKAGTLAGRIAVALRAAWPVAGVDSLAGWRLQVAQNGATGVSLIHLGAPLGAAAEALLARDLSRQLEQPVVVTDLALPVVPVFARSGNESAWLRETTAMLDVIADVDGLVACIDGRLRPRGRRAVADSLILGGVKSTRSATLGKVTMKQASQWSARIARGSCDMLAPGARLPGRAARDPAAAAPKTP